MGNLKEYGVQEMNAKEMESVGGMVCKYYYFWRL